MCFAADTCVSRISDNMPFGGVKVLEVPFRYTSPRRPTNAEAEVLERNYGIAFSGSYLEAFLLKELIAEILGHLTAPGGPELAAFERICELVGKFHQHFYEEIESNLKTGEDLAFFFGGHCPETQRVRVARFRIDRLLRRSVYEEILMGNGESFETLGNAEACERFHELINLSLSGPPCRVHYTAFRRLRDVILSGFPGVGGAIQYGEFRADGNFRLLGTSMLKMTAAGPEIQTYIRGTDIDAIHQPTAFNNLHVGYSFVLPFHDDLRSFEPGAAHYSPSGNRIVLDELITLLPFDRKWLSRYHVEAMLLRFCTFCFSRIEHIGSTAIEGMPSVPIIDIMIGVKAIANLEPFPTIGARLGYVYLGLQGNGRWHLYRKRGRTLVNLYVVEVGGTFWSNAIAIRSMLRTNSALAKEYAKAKIRILNAGGWTLIRYNRLKSPEIAQLVARL